MTRARAIFRIAAAVLLLALPARADEVVLRATARIAPGAGATLADIADLSGARATALGDTVIIPAADLGPGWTKVGLDRVQSALEARGGVAWGLISLRGSECSVGVASPETPKAAAPRARTDEARTAEGLGTDTVRGFIAARIAASLGVEPSGLRLTFDPRDENLLSMATAGRTVEARITGTSNRVPVRVAVYEGETLLVSRAVGIDAQVQRNIAVALHNIRKGEIIGADDLAREDRWVGPELACVPADEVAGTAAKSPIDAGQVVTTNDIQSPVVIKRGDLVTVTSISGGVLVRATARARSAAKDGELVMLETMEPDRKQRRTYTARACGRGQAVVSDSKTSDSGEEEDSR